MKDRDSAVPSGAVDSMGDEPTPRLVRGSHRVAPVPMVPIPIPLELVCPPPVPRDPGERPKRRRSRRRILVIAFVLAAVAALPWLALRGGKEPVDETPAAAVPESPRTSPDTAAPKPEPAAEVLPPPPLLAAPSQGTKTAPSAVPSVRPRPKAAPRRPRCGVFGSELCPPR
jgi:hypothetical protein